MGLMSKLVKGALAKKAFDFARREASKPKNQQKLRELLGRSKRR